ncbi:MAG: ATP-binding cassette domain-containing protein [Lentisphaeria bacterium]|nr:ATP-binding cassette domain-containing protein [Lentisphaeria bacterium]
MQEIKTDITEKDIPAIEVKDLVAKYGERVILDHISFTVPKGEIITVLGGSGCGKSTLLKHITGLYTPFSGDILLDGRSIVYADEEEKRRITRFFGVAYQGGALFRSFTVGENVALPMEEYTRLSKEEIRERVKEKLKMVNLDGFQDLMPSDLSGGMLKRCAFARAMALDPMILFFDEPSAGLDPVSSASLDELILQIREKTHATILIVTHELDSIFRVSDRSIMLDAKTKKIIADGKPAYLRDHCENPDVRMFLNRGKL